jgi:hypothetical protein
MKKNLSIFLCAFAALFFGSCTDLLVDEESALKADLPSDFDWGTYAKINNDVASSQIIFDVRGKNKVFSGTDSAKNVIKNCANLLRNEELAEKIYLEHAGCPKQGWNRNEKCPGIYANNSNYNKEDPNSETGWQCIMGTSASSEICWLGGWGELKDTLQDILSEYLESMPTAINFAPIKTMCMFIPQADDASGVISYLETFPFDSVLVIKHYKSYGCNDGRPYKYCEDEHKGDEKSQEKYAYKRGNYYDYGRYTFCLNEADQKIYVIK